jgi:hypothetical protein
VRVVLLMLIESGPAWRLFRVKLCDHLRGWDMVRQLRVVVMVGPPGVGRGAARRFVADGRASDHTHRAGSRSIGAS